MDKKSTVLQAQEFFQAGNYSDAEKLCLSLLKHKDDGLISHILGLILMRTNRFEQGIIHLQKSLELQPNNAHFFNNAGIAFKDCNYTETAKNLYLGAIAIDCKFAQAYFNLALLLSESLKTQDEALKMYTKALECDCNFIMAFNNRGNLLRDLNRYDEALNDFKRALEIDNQCSMAHFNIGNLYFDTHKFDSAIEAYALALKYDENYQDAKYNMAACYDFMGNLDKAIELFDQLIIQYGASPLYLAGLASVYEKKNLKQKAALILQGAIPDGLDDYIVLLQVIKLIDYLDLDPLDVAKISEEVYIKTKNNVTNPRAIEFAFSLGKLFDKLKNYRKAFYYYRQANNKDNILYNHQTTIEKCNNAIAQWQCKLNIVLDKSLPTPIFIIGMPRSGSTLVETILDRHSDVVAIGESTILSEVCCEAEVDVAYFKKIKNKYEDSSFYVDKNLFNFWRLPLLDRHFANAKIIHCQRHPLDVVLSIYSLSFIYSMPFSGKLEDIANYYVEYMRLINFYRDKIDILEISNKELSLNPEIEIKKILDYCNLPWQQQCLSPHKSNRLAQTASYNQVRQPINASGVDRWKAYEKYLVPAINILEKAGLL